MEEIIKPYGYIYKTTNLINGKIYIGKKESPDFDPNYVGSGKALWGAIKKHGRENFFTEFLISCFSKEELNAEERFLIDWFDCRVPKGYNISEGGDWGDVSQGMTPEQYESWVSKVSTSLKGRMVDYRWLNNGIREIRVPQELIKQYLEEGYRLGKLDSFKSKRSEQMQGENNSFYGRNHSETTKARMSESHLGLITLHDSNDNEIRVSSYLIDSYLVKGWLIGESSKHRNSKSNRMKVNNPMKGKKHSPETIAKMREANKGRDMSNRVYHNICKNCGSEFLARSSRTRYCIDCK